MRLMRAGCVGSSTSSASTAQSQRRRDADGQVAPDVLPRERQRADQGADAQDDEDVEEVRSHDVAHGHVALSFEGRKEAHDQFGRRGADGYDRQSDQETRYAETFGQRHRSVGEVVGSGQYENESCEEVEVFHNESMLYDSSVKTGGRTEIGSVRSAGTPSVRTEIPHGKDTNKPRAKANLFAFCRGGVSKTQSKIENIVQLSAGRRIGIWPFGGKSLPLTQFRLEK